MYFQSSSFRYSQLKTSFEIFFSKDISQVLTLNSVGEVKSQQWNELLMSSNGSHRFK